MIYLDHGATPPPQLPKIALICGTTPDAFAFIW